MKRTGLRFSFDGILLTLGMLSVLILSLWGQRISLPWQTSGEIYLDSSTLESVSILKQDGKWRININEADVTMLASLPGIGETLAGRIVDYRTEHGRFPTVESITKVNGIGKKTLAKVIDDITVG